MRRVVGWSFAMSCVVATAGCTTLPRQGGSTASIETTTPIFFRGASGEQISVPAGAYRIEIIGDGATLVSLDRSSLARFAVQGRTLRHPVKLDGRQALLLDRGEQAIDLVTLLPDGSAFLVPGARTKDAGVAEPHEISGLQLDIAATQSYLQQVFRTREAGNATTRIEPRATRIASPFDITASGSRWQEQDLLVYKGTTTSEADQQRFGLVDTFDSSTRESCSAVLITAQIVLTAGHCIEHPRLPGNILVHAAWNAPSKNQNQAYADAVYQFSNGFDLRGPDLALVHLPYPGLHTPNLFVTPLYNVPPHVGLTFSAYGTGMSALYDPATETGPNGTEVWRGANFTIANIQNSLRFGDWEYYYQQNRFQQVLMSGDSGGPDLIFQNGGNSPHAILGIHSRASGTTDITKILPSGGYSVSIPRFRNWLVSVMPQAVNSWWSTKMPAYPVLARLGETIELGLNAGGIRSSTWSQASATANTMCFNRGFFTGHFDGEEIDAQTKSAGVLCSGPHVSWRDVSASEIAATTFAFTNVGDVHWAQANRAANELCVRAGLAGGRFNGYQAGDKRGLVCYSHLVARWFDATTEQLQALGRPIGDLNATHWADAAAAAKQFCRSRGPDIYKTYQGGFFNGHQSANKRGVICLQTVAASPLIRTRAAAEITTRISP